jgi:tRNA 5-methylaminomethyl-2-thiouridine biosynthesis bifunctional protein
MRAGCRDYFPIVGSVIDVSYMLKHYPSLQKGSKAPLKYIKNLYVFNGLGGRGFVFAPMMAEVLASHITKGREIDTRVCADRLFLKWCRKL